MVKHILFTNSQNKHIYKIVQDTLKFDFKNIFRLNSVLKMKHFAAFVYVIVAHSPVTKNKIIISEHC